MRAFPAFWTWYHKHYKEPGDPDVPDYKTAKQLYDDWVRDGKPNAEGHRTEEPDDGSVKTVVIVVDVAVASWALWEIGKWGVAILAAPETGGASIVVAAATP